MTTTLDWETIDTSTEGLNMNRKADQSRRAKALDDSNTVIEEVTLIVSTSPFASPDPRHTALDAIRFALDITDSGITLLGSSAERLQLSEINDQEGGA
jgi:hypothetical protein